MRRKWVGMWYWLAVRMGWDYHYWHDTHEVPCTHKVDCGWTHLEGGMEHITIGKVHLA